LGLCALLTVAMEQQSKDETVDLNLDNFNFDSDIEVQAMLKAVSSSSRNKVVKKMTELPARRFMHLVLVHRLVRVQLAANLEKILPSGILASKVVQRKIFQNPAMSKTSVKYFGVSSFWPAKIAAFVNTTIVKTMGYKAITFMFI